MKKRKNSKRRIIGCIVIGILIISAFLSYEDVKVVGKETDNFRVICLNNGVEESVDMDRYIIGVLAKEVPVDYDIEIMKTMAVIIRSYLMQQIISCDMVYADELDLNYINVESLKDTLGGDIYETTISKYEKAVNSTKDEIIMYNDQIITPLFHNVSNGKTRNAKDVLGVDVPYLKSVESERDVECEDYLQIIDYDKGKLEDISIEERDDCGYVTKVNVDGKSISGEEFAKSKGINSSCFYITEYSEKEKGKVKRIVCKGKGHGLGLSIFGGDLLAKQGYTYNEIIQYFYSDVEVCKVVYK